MTDYSELKRLAESATPGRNFDRLPMAGGGLKYECTGDDGSLVLKVDHKNDEWGFVGDNGQADEAFFLACAPSAVLALIAENERLSGECEGCPMSIAEELRIELDQFRHEVERYRQYGCGTCDGSGHLHRLDGEYFSACTSCGAYELEQAKRERDQLKAENEALRSVANELRRFATCEHMHHDKPEWHEYDEPCKVLARIDVILGHGDKSGG